MYKNRIDKRTIEDLPMRTDEDYVESTWDILKNAVKEILKKNNPMISFEDLYSKAYTMVLYKQGERIYKGLIELINDHMETVIRISLISSLNNENFLNILNDIWIEHESSMNMIHDIFIYIDRTYIKYNNLDKVYNIGLIAFRDQIVRYGSIRDNLRDTLLNLIDNERNGKIIDKLLIKNLLNMLIELGINSKWVYQEDFERPFLHRTEEYYRFEGQKLLKENNAIVYLKNIELRINEEIERVKTYLDISTECYLLEIIENELIKNHLNTIIEMANPNLLNTLINENNDISVMYKIFSTMIPDGLTIILNKFYLYFENECKTLDEEQKTNTNPIVYIEKMLNLKEKLDNCISRAFNNDPIFRRMISVHFENVLNLNKRTPEYLSIYIDNKLRKTNKFINENEIELIINKAMVLVWFLLEKDVFERYYTHHFAMRLLLNRSISIDIENILISKLKSECDIQFIHKLERMLNDMALSNSIMERFNEYLIDKDKFGIELKVKILTAGYWPKYNNTENVTITDAPYAVFEQFKTFYIDNHKERHLILLPKFGIADINATFKNDELKINKEFIIQVTTYQMLILLLFNRKDCLTYEEILSETSIQERDLIKTLTLLIQNQTNHTQLLIKTPETNEIKQCDLFKVNENFQSKLYKIKLHSFNKTTITKIETEFERNNTKRNLDEERNYEIEAAIIRIMKSRKVLHHYALMTEVIEQLRTRFQPSPLIIKRRIEMLIDREYLSRTAEDRKIYTYVP